MIDILTMQQSNKEMRNNLCHKSFITRSTNKTSIFTQILRVSFSIHQISIFVILFLILHINNKVEGSLSTSKSQLKHERNGKCKYQIA